MKINRSYLLCAVIVYLITAYFSVGHLHPDEYYQILEFAYYKIFNSSHGLTWEFHDQIRSSIQAWGVVYLYKFCTLFTEPNPFTVTFILRALSGTLSLIAVYLFINTFIDQLKSSTKQKWFILLSLFSWLAVFNSVRYSSENIAGKIFIIAFCLAIAPKFRKSLLLYFLIGVLLGLSFVVRYQVGFMIIGFGLWDIIIRRQKISLIAIGIIGLLLTIAFSLYLDQLFYGHWLLTPWRYFAANIILGKAAEYSADPWYFYLNIAAFIPYGILFIVASLFFIYARPKNPITWTMLPFLLIHVVISHKEPRFLIPLMTFMPFVVLDSLQVLKERYNWSLGRRLVKLNTIAWRFNIFALIVVMFTPPAMQIRINKLIYNEYTAPTSFNYITEGGNILDFYSRSNLKPVAISEPSQVDCKQNENCIIALTCQETRKYGSPQGKLIFSDCPNWLLKLNFNGWLDRTALYNIYELKSIESK